MTTYSQDTRRRLLNGMDSLARAVATTLGPKPGSVVLDKKSGETTIAYDGMTVANVLNLSELEFFGGPG